MLDYARQRAIQILKAPRTVVLATSGPAGVQAGEFRCEAVQTEVYMLVPRTSDHLFNLEHDGAITLLGAGWELKGQAQIVPTSAANETLDLLHDPAADWCALVRVTPHLIHVHSGEGWGNVETLDLASHACY